ncbi:MAG: TauD/TfdA family dioxygenase [Acidobacteriota bacterium]|nr:TauD/TfdA family dioxygenase [Acidobacteriota bacterium]
MNQNINVTPVSPVIGAEVSGVDLGRPLEPEAFDILHSALMTYLVLFFRDQELTFAQHKAFGRRFGELHIHPAAPKDPEHPEILVVRTDATASFATGDSWHSDVSCDVEPPMGSILRVEQVPSCGGDTLFASMYAAYDALSDQMQRFLGQLTAVHEGRHYYIGRYGAEDLRDETYPRAEHPAVRTHPVTGRSALYVNQGFTTRFKELTTSESDALLAFLVRHCASPEFQCRFRWRPNSVAFWDNRCTQHHAVWDYHPETRHGYRVTIKGDRPTFVLAE